jgi:hypothetical protein
MIVQREEGTGGSGDDKGSSTTRGSEEGGGRREGARVLLFSKLSQYFFQIFTTILKINFSTFHNK